MTPRLSLSSCWCSARYSDGYEMCVDMAGLGFDYIELSHGVRLTLVDGILRAVDEGVVKISSVHNFCPLPPHVSYPAPNLYEPTARDRRMRDQWFRHSVRTLEFAGRVGATLAIFHSGSVRFLFSDPVRRLEQAIDAATGDVDTPATPPLAQLEKTLRKVERKSSRFMRDLIDSYHRILPMAEEHGVRMAIENRESLRELPLDHVFPEFLGHFQGNPHIGYWHDAGHAQLKQQMGVFGHRQLLEANAPRLLGFHLHDVSSQGQDHLPIGSGTIDWPMLRTFVREEHTLVIELSPRLSTAEVVASREFIVKLLAED